MSAKSKIIVVPFRAFHLKMMDLREEERLFLETAHQYFYSSAQYAEQLKTGFTALADEGPVVAAGVSNLFGGTFEAWAYTTDLINKYRFKIHPIVSRMFDSIFSAPSVRRVQATIAADRPDAIRWADHLGFWREGRMEGYGPNGEDFYIYARVKRK
jgi:hypothetical protein